MRLIINDCGGVANTITQCIGYHGMSACMPRTSDYGGGAFPGNGGVCDLSYPTSDKRRGRVQGGQICPTITSNYEELYRITLYEL